MLVAVLSVYLIELLLVSGVKGEALGDQALTWNSVDEQMPETHCWQRNTE